MISGLHSCKPGNEPIVGQVKTFAVINNPATETKKAWTKIKSASADAGGSPYRITKVSPTGRTDSYGNVSFNLEIEPTDGAPTQQSHATGRTSAAQGLSKDDYWTRKEERDIEAQDRMGRAHSQEMALRYFDLKGITDVDTQKLIDMTDWFQRDLKRQPKSVVEQQAKTMFNATEPEDDEPPF